MNDNVDKSFMLHVISLLDNMYIIKQQMQNTCIQIIQIIKLYM